MADALSDEQLAHVASQQGARQVSDVAASLSAYGVPPTRIPLVEAAFAKLRSDGELRQQPRPTVSAPPKAPPSLTPLRVRVYVSFSTEGAREALGQWIDTHKAHVLSTVAKKLNESPPTNLAVKHLVFPRIRGKDTKGPFSFDPLFGVMKLFVVGDPPVRQSLTPGFEIDPVIRIETLDATKLSSAAIGNPATSLAIEPTLRQLMRDGNRCDKNLSKMVGKLEDEDIFSLKDLIALDDDAIRQLDCPVAFREFLIQKRQDMEDVVAQSTTEGGVAAPMTKVGNAIFRANVHKVKRLLLSGGLPNAPRIPLLDKDVVASAMEAIREEYKNDAVLDLLHEEFLAPFTRCQDMPRGLLLHGPPGTGKTMLVRLLCECCGLTLVEPMVSAGEVNRGIVGETEKLLIQMFQRALLLPHLPCIVAIDEIDSAVPKRDAAGSANQHGNDKVSVFLSNIAGGTDIPNLALIGASNRREGIDDAIRRRLQIQIFVGYLDMAARSAFVSLKLLNNSNAMQREQLGLPTGYPTVKTFYNPLVPSICALTVNFSGDALRKLCERLVGVWIDLVDGGRKDFSNVKFYPSCADDKNIGGPQYVPIRETGQYAALQLHLQRVSEADDIRVGTRLCFSLLLAPQRVISQAWLKHWLSASSLAMCTGRIVVDLSRPGLTLQLEEYDLNGRVCVREVNLRPKCSECRKAGTVYCGTNGTVHKFEQRGCNWQSFQSIARSDQRRFLFAQYDADVKQTDDEAFTLDDVLRIMAFLVDERNLTQLAVAELGSFIASGASTEEKFLEEVATRGKHARAPGSKTVLVLDLDSLAGVTRSCSEGSFGSSSASIGNRQTFLFAGSLFSEFQTHFNPSTRCGVGPVAVGKEGWCVVICRDRYVLREFRTSTNWPLSSAEKEEAALEEKRQVAHECALCESAFTDAKNEEPDAADCSYHPGPLVHLKITRQETGTRCVNRIFASSLDGCLFKQTQLPDAGAGRDAPKDDVVWLCCMQPVGHGGPCKKGKHKKEAPKKVFVHPSLRGLFVGSPAHLRLENGFVKL